MDGIRVVRMTWSAGVCTDTHTLPMACFLGMKGPLPLEEAHLSDWMTPVATLA